ncbi:hypothetical protein HQ545_03285 [Candidatus Woesearchaeota archaeon]|nr:hypothetical protein [Candidatus Woesearchaeota archaeon]
MDLQELIQTLPGGYCRFYREIGAYLAGQDESTVSRMQRFIKATDDIGIPKISLSDWNDIRSIIPIPLVQVTEQNALLRDDVLWLRGRNYYLGYQLLDSGDRDDLLLKKKDLHSRLVESYENNERLIEELTEMSEIRAVEAQLPLYSLLDHQKQTTLALLKTVYRSMLKEKEVGEDIFDGLLGLCADTTARFYNFLISGEISGRATYTGVLNETIDCTDIQAGDWWRELDDSAKIALYCLNASQSMDNPCELIINPFSGATELGFAFKAVGDAIGKELVEDIILLNYSKYFAGHTLDTAGEKGNKKIRLLLEIGFPSIIREDAYARLCGCEPLIVDDNSTTGSTLRELKDTLILSGVCEVVELGAVELGRIDRLGRFDPSLISELRFEPLGDRMSEAKKRQIINEALFSK